MATRKQIAANRNNAKKSAGPKTAAGKVISSYNAVKYGLFCRDLLRFPWENADEFQSMRTRLWDELQPEGVREEWLAEHILGLLWRLRRGAIAEAGIIFYRVRDLQGLGPKTYAKLIPEFELPDEIGDGLARQSDPDPGQPGKQISIAAPPRPSIAVIGKAYTVDVQDGDVLSKVRRHETSLENSLFKAQRELERLQEKRTSTSVLIASPPHP